MQQFLDKTLTIRQVIILAMLAIFTVTPWGVLLDQYHTLAAKPAAVVSTPHITAPIVDNYYPTLPPISKFNKAFVLDNQAINKLKALVNPLTDVGSNKDKHQLMQVTHKLNRLDVVTQRCWLNSQGYVAGDIVKTPDGWMRCSPTLADTDNGSKLMALDWKEL